MSTQPQTRAASSLKTGAPSSRQRRNVSSRLRTSQADTTRRTQFRNNQTLSLRVRHRELWRTIDSKGSHRFTFDEVGFPIWFRRVSGLYETYRLHNCRIRLQPAYNSLSSGLLTLSYNTNASQAEPTGPAEMLQQARAIQRRINESVTMDIPAFVFRQTPTRRFTSGPNSYMFDIDVYVQSADTVQPISVFIEYDATFQTPQPAILNTVYQGYYYRRDNDIYTTNLDRTTDGWALTIKPGYSLRLLMSNEYRTGGIGNLSITYNLAGESDLVRFLYAVETLSGEASSGFTVTTYDNFQGYLELRKTYVFIDEPITEPDTFNTNANTFGLTIKNVSTLPTTIGLSSSVLWSGLTIFWITDSDAVIKPTARM